MGSSRAGEIAISAPVCRLVSSRPCLLSATDNNQGGLRQKSMKSIISIGKLFQKFPVAMFSHQMETILEGCNAYGNRTGKSCFDIQ